MKKTNYVDAYYNRQKDIISVVERDENNNRKYKDYQVNHTLYYEDMMGTYKSMWGVPCKKFSTTKKREFTKKLNELKDENKKIHESDLNSVFRCLSENYIDIDPPELNIGYFDIETDFHETKGFADPWDTFNRITAITIYKSYDKKNYTLVMKPDLPKNNPDFISYEEADRIANSFENTILYDSEEDMLNDFFELIQGNKKKGISEVDLLVGWNSSYYDIPYMVNRTINVLGKEYTKKFCLWDQYPKVKEGKDKWGKPTKTYETFGIVHLDFLDVYKKQNGKELSSFSLDYVSELELGDKKVAYSGTLDDLYKKDFYKFIEYSRQDVMLMVRIEDKKKYLALCNQLAHMNTVNIQKTMGSVAIIEQGIINRAHQRGMVVPSKKLKVLSDNEYDEDNTDDIDNVDEKAAVGAYVREPVPGIYKMIACCDINSLYPSTLRALNIGPETIIGQIRPDRTEKWITEQLERGIKAKDVWIGVFCSKEYQLVIEESEELIIIDYEDGTSETMKAKDLYDMLFKNNEEITLSANGTLFRRDVEAVIPELLGIWYSERKEMQAKEKLWGLILDGIKIDCSDIDVDIDEKLEKIDLDIDKFSKSIKKHDSGFYEIIDVSYINDLIKSGTLVYNQKSFVFYDNDKAKYEKDFWNQRQQARKILLNSLYGSILNEGFRMYDQRMGQSVTLTGRSITKHMISRINQEIEGTYDVEGRAIVYSDTDSVASDTIVRTNIGNITIEELYNLSEIKWQNGEKEYACSDRLMTVSFDDINYSPYLANYNYVYRHKTNKKKWSIISESENEVIVTEDHSCMVLRNGTLISLKPKDILLSDILIELDGDNLKRTPILLIEDLGYFDDEYVYDIGINDDTPYFFGNGILVHNSCYFSAQKMLEELGEEGIKLLNNTDMMIQYYDDISDVVNKSFPEFMDKAFNTGIKRGSIIKAGRELVASVGYFIKKKKYALMIVDDEGTRRDVDGSAGKLKITGLDIKRSDTPKFIQDFLKELVIDLLAGNTKEQVYEKIISFRDKFRKMDAWEKAAPKKVNNLSGYIEKIEDNEDIDVFNKRKQTKKINLPGNVSASINWNTLIKMNNDHSMPEIKDGSRIFTLPLKKNSYDMNTIAFPLEVAESLPAWFKKLPFDISEIENINIDKKLINLFDCLNWDLELTKKSSAVDDFFDF